MEPGRSVVETSTTARRWNVGGLARHHLLKSDIEQCKCLNSDGLPTITILIAAYIAQMQLGFQSIP